MFNKEQIKKIELTDAQVTIINELFMKNGEEHEILKVGEANRNADAILNDVAGILIKKTGVSRLDKEKFSDYFNRLDAEYIDVQVTAKAKEKVDAAEGRAEKAELDFKNHTGDETLKEKLRVSEEKVAGFPKLLKDSEDGAKEKYDTLEAEHAKFKLGLGMDKATPKLDQSINQFEREAKIATAKARIEAGYELAFDKDDNLVGTKDHRTSLVSELLEADEALKDILFKDEGGAGGSGGGAGGGAGGSGGSGLIIPDGISNAAKENLFRAHLSDVEKLDTSTEAYTTRFDALCEEHGIIEKKTD